MKIPAHLREEAIAQYRAGTVTQSEVCTAFEARTGVPLSPRTLRSWLARAPLTLAEPQLLRDSAERLLPLLDDLREALAAFLVSSPQQGEPETPTDSKTSPDTSKDESRVVDEEAVRDMAEALWARFGIVD